MGEHETKPSNKRYRRGSVVKYRHQDFTRGSTVEQLNNIKRRTCPTDSAKMLQKQLKDARELEVNNLLKHRRLINVLQALASEIHDRKKAQAKRQLDAPNNQNVQNFESKLSAKSEDILVPSKQIEPWSKNMVIAARANGQKKRKLTFPNDQDVVPSKQIPWSTTPKTVVPQPPELQHLTRHLSLNMGDDFNPNEFDDAFMDDTFDFLTSL